MNNNQEVVVVLSDTGKPITVVRPRDVDDDVITHHRMSTDGTDQSHIAARGAAYRPLAFHELSQHRDGRSKNRDFEDQVELRRLRAENELLLQRIEHLELSQQQQLAADAAVDGDECQCDTSAAELERLRDELAASTLREAETLSTVNEFEQKLAQFQRQWQYFVDEKEMTSTPSTPTDAELRDTLMALRLRETSLVGDVNALKRRLVELETQNHVNERKIRRQEDEYLRLMEELSSAELHKSELHNTVTELERKLSVAQSKCQEDAVMSRIRDAEHSQHTEHMRRQIAELEIENEELRTSARLQNRVVSEKLLTSCTTAATSTDEGLQSADDDVMTA